MQVAEKGRTRERILTLIEIASRSGQALSFHNISMLLSERQEPAKLTSAIQSDPFLNNFLSIDQQYVVKKGYEHLFSERKTREQTSKNHIAVAALFVDQLSQWSAHLKLAAVCGSTAYGSANIHDDIDLFIIAEKNRMWLVFFKALLLARIFRIKTPNASENYNFCLSYMRDEKDFYGELVSQKTSLFAREFLSIHVLTGEQYYGALLEQADWMRSVFPKFYDLRRLGNGKDKTSLANHRCKSKAYDILNLTIYAGLQFYLRVKAFLRNLKFRKEQKMNDVFESKITKGSCVYTSKRYLELEKLYQSM